MDYFEKELSREDVFCGRIVTVHVDEVELCNGRKSKREVVDHPGGVSIVPVDADGNVYLVRQYRYPVGASLLEIPAGKLEPGEDPLTCAVRELSEETGLEADQYTYLGGVSPSPGYCRETIHIYLATSLHMGHAHLDENEFLDVVKMPFDAAFALASSNEMTDGKTIIGLLRAAQHLK
jgi:ADP-ribose pyrophosphatase